MREEKEKNPPKRRRQNADMRKYISCKKWKTEEQKLEGVEEEEKTADKLLGMGRSVDTTSSAVTVNATVKEKEGEDKGEQDDHQHHKPGEGETGDLQHHQQAAQEHQDHPGGQCG